MSGQYKQPYLVDLNQATIHHDTSPDVRLADYVHRQVPHVIGDTTVIFANHERLLCDEISKWPVVIGCVAWLTNAAVLDALRGREVGIIVQKEDWLRPDTENWTMAKQRIQYEMLGGIMNKYAFGMGYNVCGAPDMDPVMCCGIIGSQANMVARMHHKFLVFGKYLVEEVEVPGHDDTVECTTFIPHAVWTGSFNMTHNATRSLENTLLIRNPQIAAAYALEWGMVLGLAEPLNWNATYVATDMRVGT